MTNQKTPIGELSIEQAFQILQDNDLMPLEVSIIETYKKGFKDGKKIGEENIKKEWLNWLEFIEKNVIDCNIITEIGYKIEELQKGDTKP